MGPGAPPSSIESPVPLSVPDLRGNEAAYLAQCVRDNWVSSAGPFVVELERRMAELCGTAHGVAVVNGTAALHLLLLSAGVGPGDAVVVPDWTFAATANAVYHAGATPVFVDVSAATWTLDPEVLAEALSAPRRRIRAVIAVHALGHPADMDSLRATCAEAGVNLIEDAAGAIGARYRGKPVGGLAEGAIFSFNGNKTVTAGGGGMIVTDRESWAARARNLSTQARVGSAYRHDAIGFNYRMTNVNAAIGLAQVERLEQMLAAKRAIAAGYDAAIAERDDLRAMPRAPWAESACWLYSVLAASPGEAEALVAHLNGAGIQARVFWLALSAQAPYREAPRIGGAVAAALSGRVVSVPSSSSLTPDQQQRVIDALRHWRGAALAMPA